jgi:hypothetical protein
VLARLKAKRPRFYNTISCDEMARSMLQASNKIIFLIVLLLVLLFVGITAYIYYQNRPITITELWGMWSEGKELDGKTLSIKGYAYFGPDERLYLVESDNEPPIPIWHSVLIADVSCKTSQAETICQPFDPRQSKAFKVKGVLHITQAGKMTFMTMSDIDFSHSQQFIDRKWRPIPTGKIEKP